MLLKAFRGGEKLNSFFFEDYTNAQKAFENNPHQAQLSIFGHQMAQHWVPGQTQVPAHNTEAILPSVLMLQPSCLHS